LKNRSDGSLRDVLLVIGALAGERSFLVV